MDVSDSELMGRLAAGDDLALNTLMDRWGGRVVSFLGKMTGSREAAVDLAQETFVKLYQARHRYRSSGNFSTYLFTIAANLARNHARWKRRHRTLSLDGASEEAAAPLAEVADPAKTPEEAAQAIEKIHAVHEAFLDLPQDLREAMTLFVYEGMGYAEIGTVCQCSPKAAETRIYRARQLLKERLQEAVQ